MAREALSSKILVLGIDGMDARLTKHHLEAAKCLIYRRLSPGVRPEKIWNC